MVEKGLKKGSKCAVPGAEAVGWSAQTSCSADAPKHRHAHSQEGRVALLRESTFEHRSVSKRSKQPKQTKNSRLQQGMFRRKRTRRLTGLVLASVVAAMGLVSPVSGAPTPAHAAPVSAPEVTFFHGYNQKIDDIIDELRLSLVLKVPRGYVDPVTYDLKPVNGKYLRVGYDHYGGDYTTTSGYIDNRYINTAGADGALRWAKNRSQFFTIHQVISAGDNDYLVMSIEGDMNFRDNQAENNVVDGRRTTAPLFFSFETGAPGSGSAWMRSKPLTTYNVDYNIYSARSGAVSGPIVQVLWDNQYNLWSGGQANWAMVLNFDYALGDSAAINRPRSVPEGVVPSNSVGVHLANPAFNTTASGPANSVTSSFWYAWVHEDGRLVSEVNAAPIRVTGMTPNSNVWPTGAGGGRMARNVDTGGASPTLAYTTDAGRQGLNPARVSRTGEVDFRDLADRGTGYYRLVVWPETSNPASVTGGVAGKERRYASVDLFGSDGQMTSLAERDKWTAGSAYYKYTIPRPAAPVIHTPAEGSHTNVANAVVISGTGEPGRAITLKFAPGGKITDTTRPELATLVDGDRDCAAAGGCEVLVDADGKWSYTYRPGTPLSDGDYTVVALQTEQDSRFHLTSEPSNPNQDTPPTAWGASFTIDTVAPPAADLTCPTSPTEEVRPALSGTGVEAGASVTVHQKSLTTTPPVESSAAGTVSGSSWSYVPGEDLANGEYEFWVTQTDRAGNVSDPSRPVCELRVSTPVEMRGEKVIRDVAHGSPSLESAAADNWEVTVSNGTEVQVVSGQEAPAKLHRETDYTLGERPRIEPAPATGADSYLPVGTPECVDGEGTALSPALFDRETAVLRIGLTDSVAVPITCTVSNQASHVSYIAQRIGGQAELPPQGWGLSGTSATGQSFDLDSGSASAVVTPGDYKLRATVPAGLAIVGMQQLDSAVAECAAYANAPLDAPNRCWVEADLEGATSRQGTHGVFRVVASSPADMPRLPLTGGLGSLQFVVAGAVVLALATASGVLRMRRAAR